MPDLRGAFNGGSLWISRLSPLTAVPCQSGSGRIPHQRQRVPRGAGQQRRRFAPNPGFMTGAIIGREEMSALAAEHLKEALLLVPG